jgi:hypothetical protein
MGVGVGNVAAADKAARTSVDVTRLPTRRELPGHLDWCLQDALISAQEYLLASLVSR